VVPGSVERLAPSVALAVALELGAPEELLVQAARVSASKLTTTPR
jgi:hypothetical protein